MTQETLTENRERQPAFSAAGLLAELREHETGLRRRASNLLRQGDGEGFRWCAAVAHGVEQAADIVRKSANVEASESARRKET